jgi:hypothetical protein
MQNKIKNQSSTKRISQGHYLHLATGLHIVFCMGEQTGYWNIWKDADLIDEWAVGLNTKWQCIEMIENSMIAPIR